MIPSAERFSDILQTGICHAAAQIHNDLPRINDLFIPALGRDVQRRQVEMVGYNLNDEFRSHLFGVAWGDDVL